MYKNHDTPIFLLRKSLHRSHNVNVPKMLIIQHIKLIAFKSESNKIHAIIRIKVLQ